MGRRVCVLHQNRGYECACGPFALCASNVYGIQTIEVRRLSENPPLSFSRPKVQWVAEGFSHLIPSPAAPIDHLRNGGFVHAHAGFPDSVDD